MKRIEFIAPVEAMRGNLSGAQNLKYPTENNKAFESPEGSVNYARNYSTRFIGAKRASDGLKYFAVKTKTATHITTRSLMAMALLGGAGAMYAALVRNKASQSYAGIYAQWVELQNIGETRTFRNFVMDAFRRMLASKERKVVFAGPRPGSITIYNPWTAGQQTTDMQVSQAILVKFWAQLAVNGISYDVDGMKGIATAGDTFEDIFEDAIENVLNFSSVEIGGNSYVKTGSQYLKYGEGYVQIGEEIISNAKYTLTDIAPSAE